MCVRVFCRVISEGEPEKCRNRGVKRRSETPTTANALDGYDFDAFVWDAIEELHPNRDEACDMTTEQRVDWLMAHRDLVDEYMKD